MKEAKFNKINKDEFVLFKNDLVYKYYKHNGNYPDTKYRKFLGKLSESVHKITVPVEDIMKDYHYSNLKDISVGAGWNIYHYYVDKIITKDEYPEYFL